MRKPRQKKETLTKRLVDQMLADIAATKLKEGELFMTVAQVAGRYGVSYIIAREAISQLRALGVLESRQRLGLLVGRPDPVELMARWVPLYARQADKKQIETLARLRYALEVGSVDFAVANGSSEQLERLLELAERFEKVTSESGQNEMADQIEVDYHSLLLAMTGDPLIAGMHAVLSDYFKAAAESVPSWREVAPQSVWEHRAIAEAIARRDAELARGLLRRHMERMLVEISSKSEASTE